MSCKKKLPQLGKLPPRYRFILNPYQDVRLLTCPECSQRTLIRKIPLAVHVDPHFPTMLNKHCRYCPKCEILICHQDELEQLLVQAYQNIAPEIIGNNYLVLGTFDKSTWKKRNKDPNNMGSFLDNLHGFKEYLKFEYIPAHWGPSDPKESKMEKRRDLSKPQVNIQGYLNFL